MPFSESSTKRFSDFASQLPETAAKVLENLKHIDHHPTPGQLHIILPFYVSKADIRNHPEFKLIEKFCAESGSRVKIKPGKEGAPIDGDDDTEVIIDFPSLSSAQKQAISIAREQQINSQIEDFITNIKNNPDIEREVLFLPYTVSRSEIKNSSSFSLLEEFGKNAGCNIKIKDGRELELFAENTSISFRKKPASLLGFIKQCF